MCIIVYRVLYQCLSMGVLHLQMGVAFHTATELRTHRVECIQILFLLHSIDKNRIMVLFYFLSHHYYAVILFIAIYINESFHFPISMDFSNWVLFPLIYFHEYIKQSIAIVLDLCLNFCSIIYQCSHAGLFMV